MIAARSVAEWKFSLAAFVITNATFARCQIYKIVLPIVSESNGSVTAKLKSSLVQVFKKKFIILK